MISIDNVELLDEFTSVDQISFRGNFDFLSPHDGCQWQLVLLYDPYYMGHILHIKLKIRGIFVGFVSKLRKSGLTPDW